MAQVRKNCPVCHLDKNSIMEIWVDSLEYMVDLSDIERITLNFTIPEMFQIYAVIAESGKVFCCEACGYREAADTSRNGMVARLLFGPKGKLTGAVSRVTQEYQDDD